MTTSGKGQTAGVSGLFIAGYTMAQIGAFIGFVPLLNVLLPIKAAEVAPVAASLLLSQAALCGAAAAGVAYLLTGILSDSTRSRFGRRRPWMVIGAFACVMTYGAVLAARTPVELIAAIVAFQVAFNILFAPLVAVFADSVPDRQKGLVSAFMGAAYPAANLFAGLLIAVVLTDALSRFIAVGAAVLILVLPFAIFGLRETEAPPRVPIRLQESLSALKDRNFLLVFVSRLLVQTAITLNLIYLLFYLKQDADIAVRLPHMRPEQVLGLLIIASTATALLAGFVAGLWSDRIGRRKVFVTLGGLALGVGSAVLAFAPSWPGPIIGQVILGLGLGVFTTTEAALVAQILPTRVSVARDLGVMNLAITLPQIIAPLLGIAVLVNLGGSVSMLFALACVCAVAGGLLVQAINRAI